MLTACEDREKTAEPTQVAARVNSQDISVHQVEAILQTQPGLAARLGDKAVEKVLNSLIEQELAAQAAKAAAACRYAPTTNPAFVGSSISASPVEALCSGGRVRLRAAV